MNTELTARVQHLIDERVASGDEVGLQVAVYLDGDLAVNVWAGIADEVTGCPVDGNTLFSSWSMTKGLVATCLHLLVDRGQVVYDAPIATYWPEFAANGKGSATIRHALGHCVLYAPSEDALFVGDAINNIDIVTGQPGAHVAPRTANTSTNQAYESLSRIEGLEAHTLYFGHGDPSTQGTRAIVAQARAKR